MTDVCACARVNVCAAYGIAAYVTSYACKGGHSGSRQELRQMQRELMSRLGPHNGTHSIRDLRTAMLRVGFALCRERTVSVQEACLLLTGHHLAWASRTVVFVCARAPSRQSRQIRPARELERLPPSSRDVLRDTMIQLYPLRPAWAENMTLYQFCRDWRREKGAQTVGPDQTMMPADTSGSTGLPPQQMLLNNSSRKMVRLERPAVVKVPYLTLERHGQELYFQQLMLHIPWRDMMSLVRPNETAEAAHRRYREVLLDAVRQTQAVGDRFADQVEERVNELESQDLIDRFSTAASADVQSGAVVTEHTDVVSAIPTSDDARGSDHPSHQLPVSVISTDGVEHVDRRLQEADDEARDNQPDRFGECISMSYCMIMSFSHHAGWLL
jgi:hypothetical protein